MVLPVLNTRQVLLEHLLAKVIPLCSTKLLAKEILLEIANNLQNQDILDLLQNDKLLFNVVNKSNAYKNEKQELGEELFYKISEIESDLCAKITGMLLELDTITIKQLLFSEELLSKAVLKAKREYVEYTNQAKYREELGEKLYNLVCGKYRPEIASRLTGMLLELEPEIIRKLIKTPKELEDKIAVAYKTYLAFCAMANQQELSDFIKKVHIDLRLTSRTVGATVAWKEHCQKEDVLKKYAETMQKLATLYWDSGSQNVNRICWIVEQCVVYFSDEGHKIFLEREQKLSHRFGIKLNNAGGNASQKGAKPLKLLDVGSCYNPFKNFELFDVTAIDLAPANEDVLRCDFLDVHVGDSCQVEEKTVITLPREHFDIVVFSLLLEYLPHPSLRYECCQRAYNLLRPGGLLQIITPDSKHASANSQQIKTWRLALAHIGFLKVNYEKTEHLHCMCYSKSWDRRIPRAWLLSSQNVQINPDNIMIIPQDHVQYKTDDKIEQNLETRCESDNKILADNFSMLAGDNLF